jgi:hypothetical protein
MATTPGGQGLGALGMAAAKLTLRVALQTAANNPSIIAHVARRMAEAEGVPDFKAVKGGDRALWSERARVALNAVVETIG